MAKKTPRFDIPFGVSLMQKSSAQVLEQCKRFNVAPHHGFPHGDPDLAESLTEFDSTVSFFAVFECSDYQAQSFVSVNFSDDVAVECVISLGRPLNLERYSLEHEVLKKIIPSLEKTYGNGRVLEEKEQRTCMYTWKKDYRTLIGLVSYPPDISTSTGVWLGIQIRDTLLHPEGKLFEDLHEQAQGRVANLEHMRQWRRVDNKATGKSVEPKESGISKAFLFGRLLVTGGLAKLFPSLSYKGTVDTQITIYNRLKRMAPGMTENELLNKLIMSRIRAPLGPAPKDVEYTYYAPLLHNSYKTLEEVILAIVEYEHIVSREREIHERLSRIGYSELGILAKKEEQTREMRSYIQERIRKKVKL